MRKRNQNISQTLSKRQFITLCNEVAMETPEIRIQTSEIERKTALLKRLLSKVAAKMRSRYMAFRPI